MSRLGGGTGKLRSSVNVVVSVDFWYVLCVKITSYTHALEFVFRAAPRDISAADLRGDVRKRLVFNSTTSETIYLR